MSGIFGDDNAPLPPSVLRTPAEQHPVLAQLHQQSLPLTLIFKDHNQRFLTYLAGLDQTTGILALDPLVPSEGQRLLLRGEPFRIDAYLDGVHIHWQSSAMPSPAQLDGHPVSWFQLPDELIHHQKRNTFRARTLQDEPVSITLMGSGLNQPLGNNSVLDLSATGCKVHLKQAGPCPLQPGQVLHRSELVLPSGKVTLSAEVRHIQQDEHQQACILGLKFLHSNGMSKRLIERYVNHLQRESRRRQEGDLF